MFTESRLTVL